MKILFDHQTFTQQEFGGISRYFFELVEGLNEVVKVDTDCPLIFSNNDYIRNSKYFSNVPLFKKIKVRGKRKIMSYVNTLNSKLRIRTTDFDIFHPTYYDPYYLNTKIAAPIIITCLDMIHEKFIPTDKLFISNKKKVLKRADVILAISNSTKRDLLEIYDMPSEKIKVTHLAGSLSAPISNVTYNGPPYFLYVGMRNLYKNFIMFLTAISPILQSTDFVLVCAGGGAFTREEFVAMNKLGIENKVIIESASDENLIKLYSNATAFFYPSKYEGFGIPILEAMGCNCPVVCSNTSSLPEVGGDAALYFDPNNKDSIYKAALMIIGDNEFRNELKQKGKERVKQFSWNKTVLQTHQIYSELV